MATVNVRILGVERTIADRRATPRNTQSDTPRTDAEAIADPFYPGGYYVDADFARRLERELAQRGSR